MNTTTNTRGVEIPGLIEMSDLLRKRGVETRSYRDHEIAEAAFRAALEAALSAEPAAQGEAVAWRWRDNVRPGLPWYLTDSADYAKQLRQSDMYVVEDLYLAPPAQATERVPEAMPERTDMDGYSNGYVRGWNECRAAMLAATPAAPAEEGDGKEGVR